MSKYSRQNRRIHCRSRGASLIELLVAAAVLSVAIAGISELLWANTSWTSRIYNKSGAYFSAQKFLNLIKKDIDSSYAIDFTSTSDTLVLYRTSFDENGFPTTAGSDQITYSVTPELEDGTANGRFQILRSSGVLKNSMVAVKGVSGPTNLADTSKLMIFQYVPKRPSPSDSKYGIKDNAAEGVGSVIINLEILNREMGKNVSSETNSNAVSDIGIRAEIFTRNETSAI